MKWKYRPSKGLMDRKKITEDICTLCKAQSFLYENVVYDSKRNMVTDYLYDLICGLQTQLEDISTVLEEEP